MPRSLAWLLCLCLTLFCWVRPPAWLRRVVPGLPSMHFAAPGPGSTAAWRTQLVDDRGVTQRVLVFVVDGQRWRTEARDSASSSSAVLVCDGTSFGRSRGVVPAAQTALSGITHLAIMRAYTQLPHTTERREVGGHQCWSARDPNRPEMMVWVDESAGFPVMTHLVSSGPGKLHSLGNGGAQGWTAYHRPLTVDIAGRAGSLFDARAVYPLFDPETRF